MFTSRVGSCMGAVTPSSNEPNHSDNSSNNKKTVVAAASAVTAAGGYHPIRTLLVNCVANAPLTLNPARLYKGFAATAAGSHQLFVMRVVNDAMNHDEANVAQRMAYGAVAGVASVPTSHPFELAATRRQLGQAPPPLTNINQWTRGLFAFSMRQAILGACMFVLPKEIVKKWREEFPDSSAVEVGASVAGGAVAAVLSQVPETARILAQKDLEGKEFKSSWDALKQATGQMVLPNGRLAMMLRLTVLVVATAGVNISHRFFNRVL